VLRLAGGGKGLEWTGSDLQPPLMWYANIGPAFGPA
jgi:hypothetical protein